MTDREACPGLLVPVRVPTVRRGGTGCLSRFYDKQGNTLDYIYELDSGLARGDLLLISPERSLIPR